jgi:hypothetical protein
VKNIIKSKPSPPSINESKGIQLQKKLDSLRKTSRTPTLKSRDESFKEPSRKNVLRPSYILAYAKATLLKKWLVSLLRYTGQKTKIEISAKVWKNYFGTKMERIMEKIVRIYFPKANEFRDSQVKFPPLGPSASGIKNKR